MGDPLQVIPLDGDGTDVHLETQAVVYLVTAADGIAVRGVTYTDRCTRTADGWRFAWRRHRLTWAGTMPGAPA